MKRYSPIAAILAAALLAPLPAHSKDSLRVVSSSAGAVAATAYVAKKLGYFDEQGLDVQLIDGGGGSNAVASLVGGSAQIGIVGIKNMSEATVKGQAVKAVGTAIRGFPLALVVRPDLHQEAGPAAEGPLEQKAALLRGKKIAVNDVGGSSGDFVRYAIAAAGLNERDVVMVNINDSAGRLSALKYKRIDAIVTQSPELETALSSGIGAMLISTAKDIASLGKIEYMVQAVRADYLAAHPDIVARYLAAIGKAERTIKSNPDQAKAAFYGYLSEDAKGAKLDDALADQAWKNLLPYLPDSVALWPQGIAGSREFFRISEKVSDEALYDASLANRIDQTAQ
jgi:NitT/TauT family transport system substrate-binding protein